MKNFLRTILNWLSLGTLVQMEEAEREQRKYKHRNTIEQEFLPRRRNKVRHERT